MKATLKNIEQLSAKEFDLTEEDYAALLECQKNRTVVEITCEDACIVDKPGDFANNYHDISFPDGNEFCAMSGYHLKVIAKTK